MNWAAFRAGINRYGISDYRSQHFSPITLATIPDEILPEVSPKVRMGEQTSLRPGRILLAAHIALEEVFAGLTNPAAQPIPFFQACTQSLLPADDQFNRQLIDNLIKQAEINELIGETEKRCFFTGRNGVLEAVEAAFNLADSRALEYVLVGGSDSFDDPKILQVLDRQGRVNCDGCRDGFTPGDGAGYMLLTPDKENAMTNNGHCVYLCRPQHGFEKGHLYSDAHYSGDGLSDCFRQLFQQHSDVIVERVYASMNGENHWSKEYGIARMRNRSFFVEEIVLEHPADCYGDIGAATGAALITIAALDLWKQPDSGTPLVYCSSDNGYRSALIMGTESV